MPVLCRAPRSCSTLPGQHPQRCFAGYETPRGGVKLETWTSSRSSSTAAALGISAASGKTDRLEKRCFRYHLMDYRGILTKTGLSSKDCCGGGKRRLGRPTVPTGTALCSLYTLSQGAQTRPPPTRVPPREPPPKGTCWQKPQQHQDKPPPGWKNS